MNEELLKLIADITKEVSFKTKNETFNAPNHGSSDGEPVEVTLYWNTIKCAWTDRETAIEDYVISKLKPYIKETIKQ